MSPRERFNQKVEPEPNTGCWLWSGATHWNGYGNFRVYGRDSEGLLTAHRAAWVFENGQIPEGALVLHKCHVRRCVNPSHLYLGTNSDNQLDRVKAGRMNAKKGHRGFHESA